MQLLFEDREFEIAQLGPDFLILREPVQLPPAPPLTSDQQKDLT